MDVLGISNPSFEDIDACQSSNKGEQLLHDIGVETEQLNPPHYFVPWITFDFVL